MTQVISFDINGHLDELQEKIKRADNLLSELKQVIIEISNLELNINIKTKPD